MATPLRNVASEVKQTTLISHHQQPQNNVVTLNPETLILRAIEAKVPVEALERLLAMRAELKQELAREAFNNSLATFQASIPYINKSKVANTGKYSYRYSDIADIQRAIAPCLADCGLSVTFDMAQEGDTLKVTCIVHHTEGHNERATFPVPIDRTARMNDTQKVGSALTYGRRYALCAVLGIVTAEDDDDGQCAVSHAKNGTREPPTQENVTAPEEPVTTQEKTINEEQCAELLAKIDEYGLNRERVKAWISKVWKLERFYDLSPTKVERLTSHFDEWRVRTQSAIMTEKEETAETTAIEADIKHLEAITNVPQAIRGKLITALKQEVENCNDIFSLLTWWHNNQSTINLLGEADGIELREYYETRKAQLSETA